MRILNIPIGTKSGKLTAISFAGSVKGTARWNCHCECGNDCTVSGPEIFWEKVKSCGCLSPLVHDLSGKIFGAWTVIGTERLVKENKDGIKKSFWLCKCKCGFESTIAAATLVNGSSIGCKYCGRKKIISKPAGVAARNVVYSAYRSHARKRKISWELSKEDFLTLINQNCHYCGCVPKNVCNLGYGSCIYSGIDRVNSDLGYFLGNVVPCCKVCNQAKNNQTVEEFLTWADRLVKHMKEKYNSSERDYAPVPSGEITFGEEWENSDQPRSSKSNTAELCPQRRWFCSAQTR